MRLHGDEHSRGTTRAVRQEKPEDERDDRRRMRPPRFDRSFRNNPGGRVIDQLIRANA